jgi:cysteinyl-tRNA synthetase
LIVLLGVRLESLPPSKAESIAPLVEALLELRDQFRRKKQWVEADAIREALQEAEITIEDTQEGSRWLLK